jgi:hypothetical protein
MPNSDRRDLNGTHDRGVGMRREHPLFFWGMVTVSLLLLAATVLAGLRVTQYRAEAATLDREMSQTEKETRDRILNSQAKRSELAIALLQREMRLRELEEEEIHLALSVEDSTLSLRHGPAILREAKVVIGPDSVVTGADGRSWRLVQVLGERHLAEKQVNPTYTVPEWVYASRGEAVPPEAQRRIEGGLGRYVLRLDDGTEIHTRPSVGPFAQGVRPAGFIVEDEADMAAIFDALKVETPVYIY